MLFMQDSLVRGVVGASDSDLEEEPTPLADLVVCPDYEKLVSSWDWHWDCERSSASYCGSGLRCVLSTGIRQTE